MQAAPVAAMKDIITSGNAGKLILVFTHFDEVRGDNLPDHKAKEQHVLASAENVLSSISNELGPFAERALRSRLKEACFFVGGIDEKLDPSKNAHKRTIARLQKLLSAIHSTVEKSEPVVAKPVYDRKSLLQAVKIAAGNFHDDWRPRLGLASKPGVYKEHWRKVWALSRRLSAPEFGDEYDNLKPVADLRRQLQDQLYRQLQKPVRWDPVEPEDDSHKQQVYDALANILSSKMLDLATRRVRADRMDDWLVAFIQSGRGSTTRRASIIGEQIYERAAPISDTASSPDRNSLVQEVMEMLDAACSHVGAKLD
jgi:hypothetical protein